MPSRVLLIVTALSSPALAAPQDDASASASGTFRLHGRFVDSADAPVPGVSLLLSGGAGVAGALPATREFSTNANGAFEVTFDADPATGYRLVARHLAYADVGWLWPHLPPPNISAREQPALSSELDLGTTALRRVGILEGFLVDESGALLTSGWTIRVVERLGPDVDFWRDPQTRVVGIDADTGEFEVTDLGAGPVHITAQGDSGRKQTKAFAITVPGEVTRVQLVDASPDPEQRLRLTFKPIRGVTHPPERGTVYALDADGWRTPLEPDRRRRLWMADGVPRGEYTLVVDDPRFERWEQREVRTGTTQSALLVGSSSLDIAVVDDESGAPVEGYELSVEYLELSTSARTSTLRAAGAPAPESHRYSGLVAGSCAATVHVDGCVPSLLDVPDLGPGEVRSLVFHVGRGLTLRGRLLEFDGTPLVDAEVALTRGDLPGLEPPRGGYLTTGVRTAIGNRSATIPARIATIRSGVDGDFRFEGLSPGRHTLSVHVGPLAIRDWAIDVAREAVSPVELRMPPRGSLQIEVVPRPGVDLSGLQSMMLPTGWSDDYTVPPAVWPARTHSGRTLADEGGRFAPVVVVAGNWDVWVHLPHVVGEGPLQFNFQRPAVVVAPNETTRVSIDFEREWPTHVHLLARTEGEFEGSGGVALLREDSARTLESRSYVHAWRAAETDQFAAQDEWVSPGIYRVAVTSRGWRWISAETFEIGATEPATIEVKVPLVSGALRVVDEHGAPRAGLDLEWWLGDARSVPVRVQTDGQGCFELSAPAGTLQLAFTREVELDPYGRPRPGWREKIQGPAVAALEWAATSAHGTAPQREVLIPRAADG